MESKKVAVEQQNGPALEFNFNSDILEDLYLTMENELIIENIKNFEVDIKVVPNQVATKVTKHNKVAIVSIVVSEDRKYQYLVGENLNIENLEKLDSMHVPEQMKGLIKDALLLAKKNA